jgi:hypothetical protein
MGPSQSSQPAASMPTCCIRAHMLHLPCAISAAAQPGLLMVAAMANPLSDAHHFSRPVTKQHGATSLPCAPCTQTWPPGAICRPSLRSAPATRLKSDIRCLSVVAVTPVHATTTSPPTWRTCQVTGGGLRGAARRSSELQARHGAGGSSLAVAPAHRQSRCNARPGWLGAPDQSIPVSGAAQLGTARWNIGAAR